jgi:hypothetical protein
MDLTDNINEIDISICEIEKHMTKLLETNQLSEKRKFECDIKDAIKKTKSLLNNFRADLKTFTGVTQKTVYTKYVTDYTNKLKQYETTLRKELYSKVQKTDSTTDIHGPQYKFAGAKEVLDVGIKTNDQILNSLRKTEAMMNITEDIGRETSVKLQEQNEAIIHIDNELNHLETGLQRASRDVKWFAIQMSGDKCFLTISGLLVIGVALLIFYLTYKNKN